MRHVDGFPARRDLAELFILAEGWNSHPAWSGWTIIDTTDMAPTDVAGRILEQL